MTMHYNIELKKKLCYNICINGDSTIKTAEEFNVPLKTLEKWITAFNKNSLYKKNISVKKYLFNLI